MQQTLTAIMVDINYFRKLALSFPETTEAPHFELQSFRYREKIFATFWEKEHRAMLKLTPVSQSVFCSAEPSVFSPVPGKWGTRGATFVELGKVHRNLFRDALATAYETVSQTKIRKQGGRVE